MACIFNNEEVGSGSYMGADSNFLYTTLLRVFDDLGIRERDMYDILENSWAVSSDNAQGYHPNYPEKYDAQHRCILNQGVAVKISANQKYTTDSVTAARFREICRKAGAPCQWYENHPAIPGGSTLGNLLISQLSIHSVDIGLPQVAMHSATETMGSRDVMNLVKIFRCFYNE